MKPAGGLAASYQNRSFRFKVLLVLFLVLLLLSLVSDWFFYSSARQMITDNIQSELNNTTAATVHMINTGLNSSIHNYLRAVAEKNLDIVEMFYQDAQNGLLTEEQAKSQAALILLSQTIGQTGYVYVVNSQGIIQVHPKVDLLGADLTSYDFMQEQMRRKDGYLEYDWKNPDEVVERPKALYMVYFQPWDWIISVSSYREEFLSLVTVSDFRDNILALHLGESGYAYVINSQGDLIIHPSQEGSNFYDSQDSSGRYFVQEIIRRKTGQIAYPWQNPGEQAPRDKLAVFDYIPEQDWYVVSSLYLDEAYRPLNQAVWQFIGLNSLVSAVALLAVGFLISRLTRPINQIAQVANRIAAGDLDQRVEFQGADEVGQLAEAFRQMVARLRQMLQTEQSQRQYTEESVKRYIHHMSELAKGNLAGQVGVSQIQAGTDDPLAVLGRQLNDTTASLRQMIQQIRQASTSLANAAAEILTTTAQQVEGASKQSAAISQVTTTVEEVKAIAEQSSVRAQEVTLSAEHSGEVSRTGQAAMQSIIESMQQIKSRVEAIATNILSLSEQTKQIGNIIATVNDIAAQSNMLALNASIEAARAGEQGKGFSVVAEEVRDLAEQSKQATAQVKAILSEIQRATNATVIATEEGTQGVEQGVQLVDTARAAIQQMGVVIDESAQIASQVKAGSQQQDTGIQQIAMALQDIHQVTVQSLSSTRQAEKSAQHLNELARNLADTVSQYT